MAHKLLNGLHHTMNFWRTQNGVYEVDFILHNGMIALECKISTLIERERRQKPLGVWRRAWGKAPCR